MRLHTRDRSAQVRRRRPISLARPEALESRGLMAVGFASAPLPALARAPKDVVVALDSGRWITDDQDGDGAADTLWRFRADGASELIQSGPLWTRITDIAAAPDGSVWVSGATSTRSDVARYFGGTWTTFATPSTLKAIAATADGVLWGTAQDPVTGAGVIRRFDPTTSSVATFSVPSGDRDLGDIAATGDGRVWFHEGARGSLAHITTDGVSTVEYAPGSAPGVVQLAVGADRTLWFRTAAPAGGQGLVARVDSKGAITASPLGGTNVASGLAIAPDGSAWFGNAARRELGRIDATGRMTAYAVPSSVADPASLTTDRDGNLLVLGASWPASLTRVSLNLAEPQVRVRALAVRKVEGPLGALDVATFTATDASAVASDFEAIVDLGQPRPSAGTIRADGKGGFVVSAPATDSVSAGTYIATITIIDRKNGHAIGSASRGVGVATFDAIPVPVIASANPTRPSQYQGETKSALVARFTTAETWSTPANFTADVTWGDGSARNPFGSAVGVITVNPSGGFDVTAPLQFASWGAIPLTVTIRPDNGGTPASVIATAIVSPAPVTSTGTPSSLLSSPAAQPVVVARFRLSGDGPNVAQFFAMIDWGDGTETGGEVVREADGSYTVRGSHAYAVQGTYRAIANVRAFAADGSSGVIAATVAEVTVTDPPIDAWAWPITGAAANRTWRGVVGSFKQGEIALDPSLYRATISWGDGSAQDAGTIVSDGSNGFLVQGSHFYARGGAFDVVITITRKDPAGAADPAGKATSPCIVADAPFQVDGKALAAVSGAPLAGPVATFRDASSHAPENYTAVVTWGDGTQSQGLVSVYGDGFVVYASHAFAAPGRYTYTVSVTETGGWGGPQVHVGTGTASVAEPPVAPPTATDPAPPVVAPPPIAPRLVSARSLLAKTGAAKVVLTFTGDFDAPPTGDLSRFRVTDAGKDGRAGTKDDRVLKIKSASYDAATKTLTLIPRGTFRRRPPFRVAMTGQAVVTSAWDRSSGASPRA